MHGITHNPNYWVTRVSAVVGFRDVTNKQTFLETLLPLKRSQQIITNPV